LAAAFLTLIAAPLSLEVRRCPLLTATSLWEVIAPVLTRSFRGPSQRSPRASGAVIPSLLFPPLLSSSLLAAPETPYRRRRGSGERQRRRQPGAASCTEEGVLSSVLKTHPRGSGMVPPVFRLGIAGAPSSSLYSSSPNNFLL